jgi:hypothetical protein
MPVRLEPATEDERATAERDSERVREVVQAATAR